jgi:hypothetical protein
MEDYFNDIIKKVDKKTGGKPTSNLTVFSKRDAACMILGQICKDSETFSTFLDVFAEIEFFSLSGIIHQMVRSPDEYWRLVDAYSDLSFSEMQSKLRGNMENDVLAPIKTLQRFAWKSGTGLIQLGVDPEGFSDQIKHPKVREAFTSSSDIIGAMITEKEILLVNAAKKLVKMLPDREVRNLKNNNDFVDKAKSIVRDFSSGKMTHHINIEDFRLAKEPFIAISTTLPPKEALAVSVVHLVKELFTDATIVAFAENDVAHISRYRGGDDDFVLFSLDESSAYSLDTNPSLFCQTERDGEWEWRYVERLIKSEIKDSLVKENATGQLQSLRATMKSSLEREHAERFVDPDEYGALNELCFHKVSETLAHSFPMKKYVMKFFKRGYSTFDEVSSNPEFVHICKSSVATGFNSDYYSVLLSDCQSVVLFPLKLWKISTFYRNSQDPKALFLSANGMTKISDPDPVMIWYFSMFQLSHTFYMLDSWREGKIYDQVQHSKSLIETTIISPTKSLSKLYKGVMADPARRIKLVQRFYPFITSSVSGAFIVPFTSKIGKRGTDSVNAGTEFERQVLESSFYNPTSLTREDDDEIFSQFDLNSYDGIDDDDDSAHESFFDDEVDVILADDPPPNDISVD